ncbi:hypothetical protein E1091_04230 [Micromonospora fluostatini]|uniref:Uncharacterized protein n=1 Tax=Micromonospora fluostatini TaxID=1629071 RepID=A0ABY2DK28_9ACTN|nr:hypothetical protein E1091_04230 [Micromonospora fluostatini]
MTEHTCVLCPALRPHDAPRLTDHLLVCEGCPARLDRLLVAVAELHERLRAPEQAPVNDRWYAVVDQQGRMTGERRRADPLSALGGAGPVRAAGQDAPVSGSRERSTPAPLHTIDLTAPARGGAVRDSFVPALTVRQEQVLVRRTVWVDGAPQARDEWESRTRRLPVVNAAGELVLVPAGDQVGRVSVASVLRSWCRDVRDTLWRGSPLPDDDVASMVSWLRDRLQPLVERFPAVADLAGEVRSLAGALRAALGEHDPRPLPVLGVPCQRCDVRSQIVVLPDGYRECAGELGCGKLYSASEWREWMGSDEVGRLLPGGRPGDGRISG